MVNQYMMERTKLIMGRRPKLRDLPEKERLEMYLKIEYRHALDNQIMALGLQGSVSEMLREWSDWKYLYRSFLNRILKEHTGTQKLQELETLKKEIEECGIVFTLMHDKTMHYLSIDHDAIQIEEKYLRMPMPELIDCIRKSAPYIRRIKEMAVEAERRAPAEAMARKIRKTAKMLCLHSIGSES